MRPDSRRGFRGDLWRVARLLTRRNQGHAARRGDLRTTILAARESRCPGASRVNAKRVWISGQKRKCPGSRGTSVLPLGADIVSLPPACPFGAAGSTGRRNTGVKSLRWGFKLQGLTGSFVELTSHFVQIGLRVHRQVGALWKVLSQQAIGVLVRPALPRALRIAKIYVDFGRQRKAAMIRKFLSPVPGQGLIQLLW